MSILTNKKFLISAAGVIVVVGAFSWGPVLFAGNDTVDLTSEQQIPSATTSNVPASVTQPLTPEKAKINQSVDQLAGQLVELSPNKAEALVTAAEAKSLRVQTLRTKRTEQMAAEAKAAYDYAFYKAKTENAGKEASLAVEKKDVETAKNPQPYQQHFMVEKDQPKVDKPKSSASDVRLKGILSTADLDGNWKALLTHKGSTQAYREGQRVDDEIFVKEIDRHKVVLSQGDKSYTLYTN